jgi:hypothetical protein
VDFAGVDEPLHGLLEFSAGDAVGIVVASKLGRRIGRPFVRRELLFLSREAIQESEEEVVDLVIVREPIEPRRTAFDDENSILPP